MTRKKINKGKCKHCGKTDTILYLSENFEDVCQECFDTELLAQAEEAYEGSVL